LVPDHRAGEDRRWEAVTAAAPVEAA